VAKISKTRGRNFELAVAKFMGCQRAHFKAYDTEGHPVFTFECKKRKEHAKTLMKWWKQTVNATQEDKLPALVMGEFNQRTEDALVCIRLKDLRDLTEIKEDYEKARYLPRVHTLP
jgi:hypothetical protein|tara:strand:- start:58 stop:405 length:348 start_codon:yes stop_codon:yes gene_type:complete